MAGMGNKSSDLRLNLPASDRKIQKRLIFDRRYGWVFDEWKDPAEEALAGGRGMFCVVPITKGLLRMASQSGRNTSAEASENAPESYFC